MKFKPLPFSGKTAWINNRSFLWFMLSLLLVHSVLKIIFYQYNHQLLFTSAGDASTWLKMIKWSLLQDLLVLSLVNLFFLLLLWTGRLLPPAFSRFIVVPAFIIINSFAVLLNLGDIIYFRFHFQRADADLLYVWQNVFNHLNAWMLLLTLVIICGIIFLLTLLHNRFYRSFEKGQHAGIFLLLCMISLLLFVLLWRPLAKTMHPAYPLIELKGTQLPFVQNSMHTFSYSVFRKGEAVQLKDYMSNAACDSLMPIRTTVAMGSKARQNVVLFIMESVPYEYFDTTSPFKLQMPFFDSLLQVSSFYNNAYCYALESNKGITAILAGLPTVTDMPVYHSGYINMPVTAVGSSLKKLQYSSFFCIGDDHDNFGFAKCMNWLGIDNYYSREDIPGHKDLPAHTMGLQDEYVLDFFRKKINDQKGPFLAIHFNISTHFPYDIPGAFAKTLPAGLTPAMKAMRYYDRSLREFFAKAKQESWFSNTRFIFVSDHWMFPEGKRLNYDQYRGFRIPVIVFDPAINKQEVFHYPVSQFDIMGTILQAAGYQDSIISYGSSLPDSSRKYRIAFSRANANLYQAFDSSYVLGYNNVVDRPEFLFNYRTDRQLRHNLLHDSGYIQVRQNMVLHMQAFFQKIRAQQQVRPFK